MIDRWWRLLDPGPAREARLLAAVEEALARRPRSLLAELLDVLLARPLGNGAWIAAAAAVVLLTTPAAFGLGAWRNLADALRGPLTQLSAHAVRDGVSAHGERPRGDGMSAHGERPRGDGMSAHGERPRGDRMSAHGERPRGDRMSAHPCKDRPHGGQVIGDMVDTSAGFV